MMIPPPSSSFASSSSSDPEPSAVPPPQAAAAVPPPPARPVGEYAALLGLDWGDSKHALALCPYGPGAGIEESELTHSAEALHAWLEALGARFQGQPVAVAVEASRGAVIAALRMYPWLSIYPIHPATSRRFSTAFTPSGAKDDGPDARVLLELLQQHRARLRVLSTPDASTYRVQLLNESRRKLVDRRTQLTNTLTSLLKEYFPQALDLVGEHLAAPLALAFLTRWPELSALQRSRPETVRQFFYAHHVRREEVIAQRLALLQAARPLTQDAVLCEVNRLQLAALLAQIKVLNEHLAVLEATLAAAFAQHPDAAVFKSLPGAGPALAPRLCALFGTDRERWAQADELQRYYGIAPVTVRSGRQQQVHWRWSAPLFARQSLVEWAGQTVRCCGWAKAYYLQQKARQHGHSAILRSLAFKWLRILWRCWRDGQEYDDGRYLRRLQERKAPFLSYLPAA